MLSVNDEKTWVNNYGYSEPESEEALASVQSQIDSIIGTGRDGKSIAKVVWNGNRRFWKDLYVDWDVFGKPVQRLKRPFVLFKTEFNKQNKIVRDHFVPRYIVLSRLEPEQYADVWESTTKFYCPDRGRYIRHRPAEAPKEFFMWFATIAHHNGKCCEVESKYGISCYGQYASPSSWLPTARAIRKGMDANPSKISPFDSPDVVAAKIRDQRTNNYVEQALRQYDANVSFIIEDTPLMAVSGETLVKGASLGDIRREAAEFLKFRRDKLENQLLKQNRSELNG